MHVQRSYFLLPKVGDHAPDYTDRGSFSDLNHQFRELSDGQHLTVLDDRSSRILLATSQLRAGEESHNWLQQATRTESEFLAEVASGEIRGFDAENPLDGVIDWSGKMSFLGWRMDNHTVSKGKEYTVHLYFRCNTAMDTSYKLFLHMDRAGHRIHSDHWPLAVSQGAEPGKHCIGCFQTDHWLPGDIVVDTYSREVPYGAPSGETEIWLGWFNPKNDNRLPITGWDEGIVHYGGSDNRARVGAFVVR
jgi:hypothetical protein